MGETANTAKMAEILSSKLFNEFHWQQIGPVNVNWSCVDPKHGKATHPSDVVFHYDDPYSGETIYVNCDLKSYSSATITAANMSGAIENLAMAVACAEKSDEWRLLYQLPKGIVTIVGLLFVYNHDTEFDRNFHELLKNVDPQKLALPRGTRLFVMGPDTIFWLNNVRNDIVLGRGNKEIPDRQYCKFFHPDLVRKKIVAQGANAATLEMLTSPWISMEYLLPDGTGRKGMDIYYRGSGESVEEFYYLIDWLLHFGVVRNGARVRIKTLETVSTAPATFQHAQQQYVRDWAGRDERHAAHEMKERLATITYESIGDVKSTFSLNQIGMHYA